MWMWRENGLEHYKNIDSRRYLILDVEGHCYVRQGDQLVRVDLRKEFRRVTELDQQVGCWLPSELLGGHVLAADMGAV